MNDEQIIEMTRQAGGEFYEGFAGSTNFVKFAEDDFEKFAELIVRECIDIAKHHVMNISTYGDAEFVDEQIKQHFGVEE